MNEREPTNEEIAMERFARVPVQFRFVNQAGQPVPPMGFHFPWEGNPGQCAMCERGREQLAADPKNSCDGPGVGKR